tara:strand:- start:776 stop:1204 length:429 start_codon:yes stop_codon:yes gene_type:complete
MKILILLFPYIIIGQNIDLESLFERSVFNPLSCDSLIEYCQQKESIMHDAYLGAANMLKAKHTTKLFKKWKSFQNGKNQLETTINNNPKNNKIRLIRYYIQNNIPKFLNYSNNIQEDEEFILQFGNKNQKSVLKKIKHEFSN